MRRFLLKLFLLIASIGLGGGALGLWWVNRPITLPAPTVDLTVEPGTTPRGIAEAVAATGAGVPPPLLYGWFRFSGQDRRIRAGSYELERGVTPRGLLDMLVRGEEATRSVGLVEGWNFRQVRSALAKHEKIEQTLDGLSDSEVMAKLGHPGEFPEGRFFPDTYRFVRGMTDAQLLEKSYNRLEKVLAQEWEQRDPDVPYADPYQALIMASLVEKETGVPQERGQIAGVFVRRMKIGMPLQTDPTVIYGLGERYNGKLTRSHLRKPTPYNTYTIPGLPPTPIAMVGREAIHAALHPVSGSSLYFVAKGDGSHTFSDDLDAHNNAVREFQIKRRADYRSSPAPTPAAEPVSPAAEPQSPQ